MIRPLAAELLKARHTRSTWLVAGLAVLLCVAWTVLQVLVMHGGMGDVYGSAEQGYPLAMITGALLAAGEYRNQTINWALLITPRRGVVITAKLAGCAVVGLLLGLAAAVLSGAVGAVLLAVTGRPVFTPAMVTVLLSAVLWTLFGASLGMLLRNQSATITVALLWTFYAEFLLIFWLPAVGRWLPAVGRWLPSGLSKGIVGWDRGGLPVAGNLLPGWLAALLFLGYTAVVATAARMVTVRRDVT